MQRSPVLKDIVLVGGGHSHIAVIKSFGMHPVAGVRVTLVSRGSRTPYSGMLPGLIAGHYTESEAFIDLVALCEASGVRLIGEEVCGIDPLAKTLEFADRPPLRFDIASLDIGSTPSRHGLNHAGGELICVKPIDRFLGKWRALETRATEAQAPIDLAVVGGGAGGVELALAAHYRLGRLGPVPRVRLVTAETEILTAYAAAVRRRFERVLRARDIETVADARIVERNVGWIGLDSGRRLAADEVLWVTQAAPARWLRQSGLDLDEDGFVRIDAWLRSTSHPHVFAAGDIASMRHAPRPKAGVFAVRQGPVLATNLRRAVVGERLRRYVPQRQFLSLISTGDRYAVASRGRWSAEGRWVWRWKDWIDRRFMRKYRDLEPMDSTQLAAIPRALAGELPVEPDGRSLRCGGCGAKVGSGVLSAALDRLAIDARTDVIGGLRERDDAALIAVPASKLVALSVDAFRPIVEDPFVFGEIAANHCLNDLYAVGAEPQTALAIVTLPVWPEAKLANELEQLLGGALRVFAREGVELVGGHTSEGQEVSLGFSVTGLVAREGALTKAGLEPGDVLVLTKPLGTGALFAANMRVQARGEAIDRAIATMRLSNRRASEILVAHDVQAATDVTGFGLAGHLLEMLRVGELAVELYPDAWPVLEGALEAIAHGHVSTLAPLNRSAAVGEIDFGELAGSPRSELLFDPQTAGGLLAGLDVVNLESCLQALRASGYDQATVVGRVVASNAGGKRIRLQAGAASTIASISAAVSLG